MKLTEQAEQTMNRLRGTMENRMRAMYNLGYEEAKAVEFEEGWRIGYEQGLKDALEKVLTIMGKETER